MPAQLVRNYSLGQRRLSGIVSLARWRWLDAGDLVPLGVVLKSLSRRGMVQRAESMAAVDLAR